MEKIIQSSVIINREELWTLIQTTRDDLSGFIDSRLPNQAQDRLRRLNELLDRAKEDWS